MSYSLEDLMKKKGLTQQQVADAIKSSRSTIQRMVAGDKRFTVDTIYKVADTLGENRVVFVAKYFPNKLDNRLINQFCEMLIYTGGKVLPIHLYKETWNLYINGDVE